MESIENIFEKCDLILENVQMSLTEYTKQTEQIEKVYNGMVILNKYALSAHDQAYNELDHPLMVGFANGATKRLSEINLNEITTENTFHMEEYYKLESVESGTRYAKRVKWNLTMSDFMGIGWLEDGEGTPTLENVETVGIFAQLFRLDYKNMAPEDKDINEYLNDFLTDAEFFHKGYHPMRDFLSAIADVTIILPLVEGIMGYDFITQEELTDLERGFKIGGALVDAFTLGASGVFTNAGMWATSGVILKTMAADAALSGVTYMTNEMLADAGFPPAVAAVMTVIASGVVTYSAGRYFFKNVSGDLVAEYTESELRQIFNEADNFEIPPVKGSAFEEAIKGGTAPDFYVGPNGKVLSSQYKDWIGTNMQQELLNQADNLQLQNAIKQLYRENSFIGDGGTADIIRFEKQTGLMLGKNGGSHVQKGIDMAKYLENKILTQDLSSSDRALAMQLLEDLNDALGR